VNVLARGERAEGVVCSNRVVWPSAAVMLVLNEDFSVGRRIATLIFRSGAFQPRKERRAPAGDRQGQDRRA